jgi:hypothetical protein
MATSFVRKKDREIRAWKGVDQGEACGGDRDSLIVRNRPSRRSKTAQKGE